VWLIPFAAATGALIATDQSASGAIKNSQKLISVSNNISRIGAGYSTFGTAGIFFLTGSLLHNQRARETGILGTEALIDSSLVGFALKYAFGRERPYQGNGQGLFWQGGSSFPSGHAITIWSLAVVIAEEYSDHKMVGVGAIGIATLVSVARFTSYNHFPSDVLVGSVFGGLIGHYVYHTHHRRESPLAKTSLKSYLMPEAISPYLSRTGGHAVSLRWKL
jgi:membrane-associated phospholipid phosphatase